VDLSQPLAGLLMEKAHQMLDLAAEFERRAKTPTNGATTQEFLLAAAALRLAAQADAPAEEMENYRMALAYISKQSTDQQSRELAETALNAFPADRVPQSPAQPNLQWLVDWVHLYATEGHSWISTKSSERLIVLATREPTQADADHFKKDGSVAWVNVTHTRPDGNSK
jgi:hypothetical protein